MGQGRDRDVCAATVLRFSPTNQPIPATPLPPRQEVARDAAHILAAGLVQEEAAPASLQADALATPGLHAVFAAYACFGAHGAGERGAAPELDSFRCAKLVREAGLLSRDLTLRELDVMFVRAKERGARRWAGGGGSTQVPGVSSTASCLLLSRAPSTLPSSGELTPASLFPTNPPRLTFAGFVQLLSLVAGKRDAPVAEVVSSVLELDARGPERRATTPEVRQVGECVEGGARRLMPSSLSCSAPPCGEVSRPLPTPHFSACIHPLQAVRFHDDRTTYTGEEGHEGWGQPGGLGWELLSHILPPPRCALCISPIPLLPPSCQACTSAAA